MREIKFRVWIPSLKEMHSVQQVSWECDQVDEVQVVAIHEAPGKGNGWHNVRDEGQLMQFTGLLDSKGVEVFDGDILEFRRKDKRKSKFPINVVSWTEEALQFSYKAKGTKHWNHIRHIKKAMAEGCTFTVIGNIHQNPELL